MKGKTEFIVFCIENIAKALNAEPQKVYVALCEKSDVATSYIVPNYEVLHSQSKEYIIADILEVMAEEGVSV